MLNTKIKEHIAAEGLKFVAVAEKCNIPANTFSAMMNGKRKITAEDYFSICNALEVPLDTFAPNNTNQHTRI